MTQAQAEDSFQEKDLYYTDLPVGEVLRRAREHYNQSLADVERALRIRASQLDAIERGDFDSLPGRVYVIGFVRSYAEYLGLDPAQVVGLLKTQSGVRAQEAALHFPVAAAEGKVPQGWFVVISLIVALGVLSGIWMLTKTDRSLVEDIPPVSVLEQVEESVEIAAQTDEIPDEEAAAEIVHPREGLIIKVTDNSWVEITDADGNAIVSKVLREGSIYSIPDRPDLVMSMGNAGGVSLEIDGQPLGAFGKSGEVMKSISLDIASLKQKYAPASQNSLENAPAAQ